MGAHNVVVNLVAKGDQAANEFKKTAQAVDRLNGAQKEQGNTVSRVTSFVRDNKVALGAVGVALGLEFAAIKQSVGAYTSYASKVREVQRVSGAGAEASSGLTYAFEKLGISSETGARAIFQLERRIGDGKVKLSEYGVQVKRTSDGSLDLVGTLGNLADAYQATNDPAKRASLLMNSFGRQGAALIPILANGRQGIKDLFDEAGRTNHLLDQGDLDRAKQFTLATRELGQTFDGLKIKIGNALTPALTQLAQAGSSVVQLGNATHAFDLLSAGAKTWADSLTSPISLVKSFTDEIGVTTSHTNIAKAAQDQYNSALANYTRITSEGNAKSAEGRRAREALTSAQKALTLIQNQYLDASGQTAAAQEQLAQKSDTYRAAIDAVRAAKDAERSGDQSSIESAKSLAAAYDQVTQAKEREAAGISNSLSTTLQLEGAQRQLNEDLLKFNDGTAQATDQYKIQQDAVSIVTAKTADYAATVQATTGHQLTNVQSMQYQLQALKDLAAQNPNTAASVQPLIDKMELLLSRSHVDLNVTANTGQASEAINALVSKIYSIAGKTFTTNIGALFGGGRASGGSVSAGSTYLVGERGPELVTMGGSGYVTPNHALGGGGRSYNITVNAVSSSAETGRAVVEAIRSFERNSGSRWRQN